MEPNGLREPLLPPSESVLVDFHLPSVKQGRKTKTVALKILAAKSTSSVSSLEAVIGKHKGVESVAASLVEGKAVIIYRPELVSVSQF